MMIVKVNQSWKTLIVRYYPMSRKDAAIMEKVNYHDLPIDWNGVIDLYNTDERHLNSYLVVNGKSLKSRLFIKSDFRENSLYGPDCFSIYVDYPVYGINGGVGSSPSGWVTICNPSSSGGPSGSGSGSYFPPEYSGGGTGTSSPPSSGGNSQPTCVDNSEFCFNPPGSSEEEIIKDLSFIGTKAECILNNLSETSNGFNSMLSKFDGDFSLVDLKFAISNELNNSTNGTTSQEGNMIIVKINGNTLNSRTNLSVARTLIHEIIHAEMFRKVRSMGGYVSQNDFPGIYDYYRRFAKNWQHEQMAAHYVSIIGDYLYEFDSKQKPLQFYRDFAWVGLYLFEDQNSNLGGNISSQAWKDLNELDKERILNSINDGETNGSKVCN